MNVPKIRIAILAVQEIVLEIGNVLVAFVILITATLKGEVVEVEIVELATDTEVVF
jgi:hypothetical protein